MLPLTTEEIKSHQGVKVFYICGKRILRKLPKSINYRKVSDYYYYRGKYIGTTHSICKLNFNVSN